MREKPQEKGGVRDIGETRRVWGPGCREKSACKHSLESDWVKYPLGGWDLVR